MVGLGHNLQGPRCSSAWLFCFMFYCIVYFREYI